jgi:hypothetical protein
LTGAGLAGGGKPLKSEVSDAVKRVGDPHCAEAVRQAAFAMGVSCAEGYVVPPGAEKASGWVESMRGDERACAKHLLKRCGMGLAEELRKPNAGLARKEVLGLPERCRGFVEGFKQACPPAVDGAAKRDPLDCLASRLEAQAQLLGQ